MDQLGVVISLVFSSIVVLLLFFFSLRVRIRLGDNEIIRQIAHGKEPVRFHHHQLVRYTNNYSVRLGAGAFGTVYTATLPNGLKLAVKMLHTGVDWRSEAEFIADVVGTIWQAQHTNLIRLVGYCFDRDTSSNMAVDAATVRAIVCEYMERGALDAFLVDCRARDAGRLPDLNLLHSLALGVARGIQYLHEGCQHKIVHYGIKPGNVLLGGGLTPKVADFGLAQLMRRGGNTHAAVSIQPPSGLVDKLDVYSFGMLVLRILSLGLDRGMTLVEESQQQQQQQWFPRVTWRKYESGNLMDLVANTTATPADHDDGHAVVVAPGPGDDDLLQRTEMVERMCKVAFWCMQQQPDARPTMGVVVKMLEGHMDIIPPPNPFNDGEPEPACIIPLTDHQMRHVTVEKFLWEIRHEKPLRFTPRQIATFTRNYSTRLGSGGFGTVFKGALPNGLAVAVKVFHASLDRKTKEAQFMAEVGTIGRTHHVNLVRLFGFCFDDAVRALVYEYMEHGALDTYLTGSGRDVIGLPALRDIAVGVARGIRYLHEECQQKIVHYDIKPGNVLLDGELTPKVADFGLARLVSRADTHVSVSGIRGTPGFAAPEMWMQSGITEKCDVYSFGMLLLEIVGRRRSFDEAAPESQRWFPMLAWNKYDRGELADLIVAPPSHGTASRSAAAAVAAAAGNEHEQEQQCKEIVERMCKVAFWCVQQLPEARPPMSAVTKMLEGEVDIAPPANPFQHLMAAPVAANLWTTMTSGGTGNNGILTRDKL